MHVFLTGATGFVGSYILRALLHAGHTVRCLVRDAEARLPVEGAQVERVKGDITNPKSLTGTLRGCDAVIHLVGILEEHPSRGVTFEAIHYRGTVHVVDAARDGVSAYQTTKWRAEEYVKQAGFDHWTIFRPAIIFGDPGPDNPEFASLLAGALIKPFPVLPVFGDGTYRLQPVSAEEVAAAFTQALTTDAARGQRYCVAGKDTYTFDEVLDIITDAVGHARKPKLHQPLWLVRPLVKAGGKLGLLPISEDQFEMLVEGNTCDPTAFYRDFELDYKPFTPANLAYLRS
jgi:uncharacterized protein YbjT (DUF2867 family)